MCVCVASISLDFRIPTGHFCYTLVACVRLRSTENLSVLRNNDDSNEHAFMLFY